MGLDKTGIVNAAAFLVGGKKINEFNATNNKLSRLGRTMFDHCRDLTFEMAINWTFATTRAQLSALTTDPVTGYDHQYGLPDNCARVQKMVDVDSDKRSYPFRKEIHISDSTPPVITQVVQTDQDTVYIKYTVMIADPAKWPAPFTQIVVLRLAFFLAQPLKQNTQINTKLERMWGPAMIEALQQNSEGDDVNENFESLTEGNNDVINAPYGGKVNRVRVLI